VQGEKIFEKVIIPKKPGEFTIGPIEYSYFDPEEKKYIIKKIAPVTIAVSMSKEQPYAGSAAALPGMTKEEVRLLKKDIAYIKTLIPEFSPEKTYIYRNKIFMVFNVLPLLLLVYLYIYEAHRQRLRTDIGYARSRRAKNTASKRLKTAKNIMDKDGVKEFYSEMYRAVIEYVADKLNIPHPSITKDMLDRRLTEKGYSKENIEKLKGIFDICDMVRFASVRFNKEDMRKSLEEALEIITEMEKRG